MGSDIATDAASVRAQTPSRPDPTEALALRRWALARLASCRRGVAPGDRGTHTVPEGISPLTWSAFLAIERCALPLARCWHGSRESLPPQVRHHLTTSAHAELRRILAARAQLQTLSTLARDAGCRPIVLKGGAFLNVEDRSYDLDDLDVLLPPSEAHAYAAALDAAGYRPQTGFNSHRHLSARSAPGSLHVEIHVSGERDRDALDAAALQDVRPISACPYLVRLAPRDHAWRILAHVTMDHLNRRGRIRDLLLLADAIVDCRPDDRAALTERIADHPAGGVMEAQYAMARAIGEGVAPVDAFAGVALTNHVLYLRMGDGHKKLPGNLSVTVFNLVFAILGGPIDRRFIWARETSIPLEPSRFTFIAWVQRRVPGLGRTWLLFFRLLRLPAALAVAAPLARAARRALGDAGLNPRIG